MYVSTDLICLSVDVPLLRWQLVPNGFVCAGRSGRGIYLSIRTGVMRGCVVSSVMLRAFRSLMNCGLLSLEKPQTCLAAGEGGYKERARGGRDELELEHFILQGL